MAEQVGDLRGDQRVAGACGEQPPPDFLGLGLPPPTASWGLMLKEVTPFLQLQPMAAFFPGLTISLIILGFNLLGDGLRDVFDPRQYDR